METKKSTFDYLKEGFSVNPTGIKPHVCPVCNGNGKVPNGFYNQTSGYVSSTSTTPETCQSCHGTGIVWG